jgi:hypothetical protein
MPATNAAIAATAGRCPIAAMRSRQGLTLELRSLRGTAMRLRLKKIIAQRGNMAACRDNPGAVAVRRGSAFV